jgi:hypothetical protein
MNDDIDISGFVHTIAVLLLSWVLVIGLLVEVRHELEKLSVLCRGDMRLRHSQP